ncbi:sugar phosphate nucleotidyltransferase [Paenibacillus sp. MMS18-CY102]|uniref:sugar phosphate nucleotidyltransferase n=1 Tax=Paenibacillus sp. MMS18-CY102 TaxID=2682849 RepID=UPI0013666B42|nr:sugar phosphate nucleotidyltransferase [Paenibacillus sp. MMS18-CY102]MWC30422.1 cupin domain-containing protein [Paenibacillus sp. MMS18-CY102]
MKIVLLSGGSGKRLWPLSNDMRSKQFLPLLQHPDGGTESMVQRVWRQLGAAGLSSSSYIATGRAQVELLESQLNNETSIIVEPERRDTFPAIALAATYLYSVEGVSLDEVVAIMPVDPYVSGDFFEHVKGLEHAIRETGAQLALMGVVPDSPSESFGYIVPSGAEHGAAQRVECFKEKPSAEVAEALIAQGALWNCGVFAFRLDTIINLLIEKNLPIQYEEMSRQYRSLPKNSFDYEVVEKLAHIAVTRYSGQWRDLGTWNTLTDEMESAVYGKGSVTEDSHNTHLVNELEIPITVIGLSNVVVAASPDGILVSDKSHSPRIKELSGDWNQRPMFEERRWGQYKVIDFMQVADGRNVLTKRIAITAGRNLSYQYHLKRSEVWTIIAGEGEIILDGSYRRITAGDVVLVPEGMKHSIRAITDLELIEVQSGSDLIEEDIVRLSMEWTEILSFVH